MVWLLQLANLQCPCLGLTSNQLRVLLFSCIKGAIRESFSISPRKGEIPSRHVLPARAPGYELPGDSWDLKIGTEERMRARFLWRPEVEAAEEPQRDALNLYIPPSLSTCLLVPHKRSPHPQAAFLFLLQHHSGLKSIFIFFVSDCT